MEKVVNGIVYKIVSSIEYGSCKGCAGDTNKDVCKCKCTHSTIWAERVSTKDVLSIWPKELFLSSTGRATGVSEYKGTLSINVDEEHSQGAVKYVRIDPVNDSNGVVEKGWVV